MTQDIADRVRKAIADQLGVPVSVLRDEDHFVADYKIELVMAVEDEFGHDYPDAELMDICTVQQAIDYVTAYCAKEVAKA